MSSRRSSRRSRAMRSGSPERARTSCNGSSRACAGSTRSSSCSSRTTAEPDAKSAHRPAARPVRGVHGRPHARAGDDSELDSMTADESLEQEISTPDVAADGDDDTEATADGTAAQAPDTTGGDARVTQAEPEPTMAVEASAEPEIADAELEAPVDFAGSSADIAEAPAAEPEPVAAASADI